MKPSAKTGNCRTMNILCFWGKAQPCMPDLGPEWHPLVFHCLDVAAVGDALLTQHDGLGASLSHQLDLPLEEVFRLVPYLLCVHDVGKFAKKFQAKVPHLYPACFDDDPGRLASIYDHGAGGLRLFDADEDIFRLPDGVRSSRWRPLGLGGDRSSWQAPGGAERERDDRHIAERFWYNGDRGRERVHASHARTVSVPAESTPFGRDHGRRASFALAGLAVLADWIGSNQRWFRYRHPDDVEDLESIGSMRGKRRPVLSKKRVFCRPA